MNEDYSSYPSSTYELAQHLLDHMDNVEIDESRCASCGNVNGSVRKKAMVCMGQVEIVRVCRTCAP